MAMRQTGLVLALWGSLAVCVPALGADAISALEAQRTLTDLGFSPGEIDGKYGPQTRSAIVNFQRSRGLPETGSIDAATVAALRSAIAAANEPVRNTTLPAQATRSQAADRSTETAVESPGGGVLGWAIILGLGGAIWLWSKRRSKGAHTRRKEHPSGNQAPAISRPPSLPTATAQSEGDQVRTRGNAAQQRSAPMADITLGQQWTPVTATPRQQPRDRTGEPLWKKKGETVNIHGFDVNGMVYVGARGTSSPLRNENSVIDPLLQVASSSADRAGTSMPYWPNYNGMQPSARRAYLIWHAGGRRDPSFGIGYVFLFFYGLERRLFIDRAVDEAPVLIREVEELLAVYGDNNSFRRYASVFLDCARAITGSIDAPDLTPESSYSFEVPLSVKLGVGRLVADRQPVPAKWMLAWWMSDMETRLRTPAKRCFPEFVSLFAKRFCDQFPNGMLIDPPRRKIGATYQPSSNAFSANLADVIGSIPDVTVTRKPLAAVGVIAEACMDALDAYSRFLGKNPAGRGSLEAVRLLPEELAEETAGDALGQLRDWLGVAVAGDRAALQAGPVLHRLGMLTEENEKPNRQSCVAASEILEKCGFGMEPDPRSGGSVIRADDPIVLFRLPPTRDQRTSADDYASAQSLLTLGALLVHSDDEVTAAEEQHLLDHLEQALHLGPDQKARLQAHLLLLMRAPPKLSTLKSRFDALAPEKRQQVARFAISVAGADGIIAPAEIKLLERIYGLLNLDRKALFSDIHSLGGTDEPATVRPAQPASIGSPVPPKPDAAKPGQPSVVLDIERLKRIREETAKVSGLLSDIFVEDEAATGRPAADSGGSNDQAATIETPAPGGTATIPGLDEPHSGLLRAVVARGSLARSEFEALAKGHGLLPDGAIEAINDWAMDRYEDLVLEDGDEVTVAVDILAADILGTPEQELSIS